MKNRYCIECGSSTTIDKENSNSWRVFLKCSNKECNIELEYNTERPDTVHINRPLPPREVRFYE